MKKKQKLGQFFTSNTDYILSGFENFLLNKDVCDPFAGKQDLLKFAIKHNCKSINGFDIDSKLLNSTIKYNDSLINIPNCDFIITNPPYLGKNKCNKNQKYKYFSDNDYTDFYMIAIDKIIKSNTKAGIIIVPINFLSADNSQKIRNEFFNKYTIKKAKYFKEQVFDDTTYNVIAFYFEKKNKEINFDLQLIPDNKIVKLNLKPEYNYSIAGKELSKFTTNLKFNRLTEDNLIAGNNKINCFYNDFDTIREYNVNDDLYKKIKNNIILFNCIDGKTFKISAQDIREYNKDALIGKITSRNIAYVLLDNVSIKKQKMAINKFNGIFNDLRDKYNSLFLTNFRDNDRKRVSFYMCYNIMGYIIENL